MKLCLNIGSGNRTYDFYPTNEYKCINFDARADLKRVDEVGDVRDLSRFSDEYFDFILASDIIEHFPIANTESLLKEWKRVLKIGAVLEIRTPNMLWALKHYTTTGDAKFVSWHIFGGQDYAENFHHVMFDRAWLNNIMKPLSFKEVYYTEEGSNFVGRYLREK